MKLCPAAFYFPQHHINGLRCLCPVVPGDVLDRDRADEKMGIRVKKLVIQQGTSGMERLAAENGSLWENPQAVGKQLGKNGIFIGKRSLVFPKNRSFRNTLIQKNLGEKTAFRIKHAALIGSRGIGPWKMRKSNAAASGDQNLIRKSLVPEIGSVQGKLSGGAAGNQNQVCFVRASSTKIKSVSASKKAKKSPP